MSVHTNSTCGVLLVSGERKNLPCGKKNAKGKDTCIYHLKKMQVPDQVLKGDNEKKDELPVEPIVTEKIIEKTKKNSNSDLCTFILLKGQRKGEQCGKKKCPSHKIESNPSLPNPNDNNATIIAPEQVAPEKVAPEPVVAQQVAPEKVASKPVVAQQVAPEKVLIKPVAIKPIVAEPITCNYIFLKGANKGERCGKKKCIHRKDSKLDEIKPIEVDSSELVPIPVLEKKEKSKKSNPKKEEKQKPLEIQDQVETHITPTPITTRLASPIVENRQQVEEFQVENQIAIREEVTCKQILKKGKRVGEPCGKQISKNGYCWFHRVQDPNEMDTDGYITSDEDNLPEPLDFCKIILTHGKYKGFRCGNMCVEGTQLCTFHHRVNYR